jgi:hypothetical protein
MVLFIPYVKNKIVRTETDFRNELHEDKVKCELHLLYFYALDVLGYA